LSPVSLKQRFRTRHQTPTVEAISRRHSRIIPEQMPREKKKKEKGKEREKNVEPVGAKALRGEEELVQAKIFEAVNYDRNIKGKGKLIQIYDPNTDPNSLPYWEYEDESNRATGSVPAYHVVRVVKAHLAFI